MKDILYTYPAYSSDMELVKILALRFKGPPNNAPNFQQEAYHKDKSLIVSR